LVSYGKGQSMNLITLQSGKRGLTQEGRTAFLRAYQSISTFEGTQPISRFPQESVAIIREIAKLRMKEWRSTSRWNAAADEIGTIGELAVQHYLGISSEVSLDDFLTGLQGDRGWDVHVSEMNLDVKSTQGQALKFKFSKTNRSSHLADGFIFVYIESAGTEVWAHMLGEARRHEIKPFLRDDGQKLFVRAETLRRQGVLKPVSLLKPSETVTTPLSTVNQ
jgi:hypothetical protein